MVKIKCHVAHSCVSRMKGINHELLIVCSGNEFIVLKWCSWWHVWSVHCKFCTFFFFWIIFLGIGTQHRVFLNAVYFYRDSLQWTHPLISMNRKYLFNNSLILKLKSFKNGSADSVKTRHAAVDLHGTHFGNLLTVWNRNSTFSAVLFLRSCLLSVISHICLITSLQCTI